MKTTLTAIALCAALVTGLTSANAACGSCNTCAPRCAPRCAQIEMAPVCRTTCCNPCDPCGGSFSLFRPSSWF